MKTYWVDYEYSYDYTNEDGVMEQEIDWDAGRFHCLKKNIKKAVIKHLQDIELRYERYSNLKVEIKDFYETTEVEV